MVTEACVIIADALGHLNDFSFRIMNAFRTGTGGFYGGPSYQCVGDVDRRCIRGAVRQIHRKARTPTAPTIGSPVTPPYVNPGRIAEIEALNGADWDFSKLAQLCKELNVVSASDCHFATAMLVRAITDHVPRVFAAQTFTAVAENYGGSSSFNKSMKHLNGSLRNIADGMLHEQIRRREALPSAHLRALTALTRACSSRRLTAFVQAEWTSGRSRFSTTVRPDRCAGPTGAGLRPVAPATSSGTGTSGSRA